MRIVKSSLHLISLRRIEEGRGAAKQLSCLAEGLVKNEDIVQLLFYSQIQF